MEQSICGADCKNCGFGKNNACNGCAKSNYSPFGEKCFVAGYINSGGMKNFEIFKKQLVKEFNELKIPGMPTITDLMPLNGVYVNMEYRLPSGENVKMLDDKKIYLGTQTECEFNDGEYIRCFGLVADADFLLVAEYGPNGADCELICYKKR